MDVRLVEDPDGVVGALFFADEIAGWGNELEIRNAEESFPGESEVGIGWLLESGAGFGFEIVYGEGVEVAVSGNGGWGADWMGVVIDGWDLLNGGEKGGEKEQEERHQGVDVSTGMAGVLHGFQAGFAIVELVFAVLRFKANSGRLVGCLSDWRPAARRIWLAVMEVLLFLGVEWRPV